MALGRKKHMWLVLLLFVVFYDVILFPVTLISIICSIMKILYRPPEGTKIFNNMPTHLLHIPWIVLLKESALIFCLLPKKIESHSVFLATCITYYYEIPELLDFHVGCFSNKEDFLTMLFPNERPWILTLWLLDWSLWLFLNLKWAFLIQLPASKKQTFISWANNTKKHHCFSTTMLFLY